MSSCQKTIGTIIVSFLVFGLSYCNVMNICEEPTESELQRKFVSFNNDLDIKTLFLHSGWNKNNVESAFNELYSLTETHRKNGTCPQKYLQQEAPFMLRTSCPWFPVKEIDNERYPREIYHAKTHCTTGCIGSKGHQKCEAIFRKITVLRRSTCDRGIYQYEPREIFISVAYLCAQQPEVTSTKIQMLPKPLTCIL